MNCNHAQTVTTTDTRTNPMTLQQTVITTVKCAACKKTISKTSQTYGSDPTVI